MTRPRVTVCIPTHNAADTLKETLESLLAQSYTDYEVIISDNASSDNTEQVIRGFDDPRIRFFRHQTNLGFGKNLQTCRKHIRGNILFLMSADDLLLKDALAKTIEAFELDPDIGVVTRPYYWFDANAYTPVREIRPIDASRDVVITLGDGNADYQNQMFWSVSQLSGLAYRMDLFKTSFRDEPFQAHIYPFAEIARDHKAVFLKDHTIAVRIRSSETRLKPSTYELSPTETWVDMFRTVFPGDKYRGIREIGIKEVAKNYIGLVQIRNYGKYRWFLREGAIMAKYHWQILLSPKFWFFMFGLGSVSRFIMIRLVDAYKNRWLSRRLRHIKIEF